MPELDQKIVNALSHFSEISIQDLMKKIGYGNRNYLFKTIDELEKKRVIKTRKVGRERLVRSSSPEKKVNDFIKDYNQTLKNYQKIITKHLNKLEKTKPLVSSKQPLKKIKTKTPVLELDKKNRVYRDLGKTQDSYLYTWKTRPKPLMHFNSILNTLFRLYQESSALSFAEFIFDDSKSIIDYQKRSRALIKDTIRKTEGIFQDEPQSLHYIIYNIRSALYGIIYQHTIKEKESMTS